MSSLDVLHYVLVIGFIILVAAIIYAVYCFTKFIKTLQIILDDIKNAARGIKALGKASNIVGFLVKKFSSGNQKEKSIQKVIQKKH